MRLNYFFRETRNSSVDTIILIVSGSGNGCSPSLFLHSSRPSQSTDDSDNEECTGSQSATHLWSVSFMAIQRTCIYRDTCFIALNSLERGIYCSGDECSLMGWIMGSSDGCVCSYRVVTRYETISQWRRNFRGKEKRWRRYPIVWFYNYLSLKKKGIVDVEMSIMVVELQWCHHPQTEHREEVRRVEVRLFKIVS